MTARGKFIVLEGIDGAGKTEQCARLVAHMRREGLPVSRHREPTAESIYGQMFSELKTARVGDSKPPQEEFLMLTLLDRLEHSIEIESLLQMGQCVVCDRYESSTWAYQGACGISDDVLRATMPLARPIPRDLEILLYLPTEAAMHRAMRRDDAHEWWSRKIEMLEAIQQRYQAIPGLMHIDATGNPDHVESDIWDHAARTLRLS